MLVGAIFTLYFLLITILEKLLGSYRPQRQTVYATSIVGFLCLAQLLGIPDLQVGLMFMALTSLLIGVSVNKEISLSWLIFPVIIFIESLPVIFILNSIVFLFNRNLSKKAANLIFLTVTVSLVSLVPELESIANKLLIFILIIYYWCSLLLPSFCSGERGDGFASVTIIALLLFKVLALENLDSANLIVILALAIPLLLKRGADDPRLFVIFRTLIIFGLFIKAMPVFNSVLLYIFVDSLRFNKLDHSKFILSKNIDGLPLRIFTVLAVTLVTLTTLLNTQGILWVFLILAAIFLVKYLSLVPRFGKLYALDVFHAIILVTMGGLAWF